MQSTGSKYVSRFRSCPEFIPHAFWLMTDETMDRANCACRYCTGQPQTIISQRLGLSSARTSSTPTPSLDISASQSVSAGGRVPRARVQRAKPQPAQPRAAQVKNYIQIATRRAKEERNLFPKSPIDVPVLADRENDVRAVSREPTRALLRWHRTGEVVWVKIEPDPIHGLIRYWPAIVVAFQTKTGRAPLSPRHVASSASASANVTWSVRQQTEYMVKMLGIGDDDYKLVEEETEGSSTGTRAIRDQDIFPYQVYGPPPAVWVDIREALRENDHLDWIESALYDPFVSSASINGYRDTPEARQRYSEEQLREAAAPFAVAAGVASQLASHWTPSDSLALKQPLRVPRPEHYGPGPATIAKHEFHGLWWGPERIWADDLVRLRIARAEYVPKGSDEVLPPAGPGPRSLLAAGARLGADWRNEPNLLHDLGASTRGVFMRIHSIHALEPPNLGRAELRLAGILYELVDDDWEEDMVSIDSILATRDKPGRPTMSSHGSNLVEADPSGNAKPTSDLPVHPLGWSITSSPPLDPQPAAPRVSRPPWVTGKKLPPAPSGYEFRPILKEGLEAEIPISMLAGRYYARLDGHPGLDEILQAGADHPMPEAIDTPVHFRALCGLISGMYSAVTARIWNRSRRDVAQSATTEERDSTEEEWMRERSGSMDVDPERKHEDSPFYASISDSRTGVSVGS